MNSLFTFYILVDSLAPVCLYLHLLYPTFGSAQALVLRQLRHRNISTLYEMIEDPDDADLRIFLIFEVQPLPSLYKGP